VLGSRVGAGVGGLEDWSGFRAQAEAMGDEDEDERDRVHFEQDADAIASDD
jgi:hypothetical protein